MFEGQSCYFIQFYCRDRSWNCSELEVTVSLFCPITLVGTLVESQVLGRNKSSAGPSLAPLPVLGPTGPYKDKTSLSPLLPNISGLSAHSSHLGSSPLCSAPHFFSLQGYWKRGHPCSVLFWGMRPSLLNSLGKNTP